jgi:hypothetical protein
MFSKHFFIRAIATAWLVGALVLVSCNACAPKHIDTPTTPWYP